jgi:hypothetical protein
MPQIPKPMHGVAPRAIMGQAWWDIQRQAAYYSTDYRCAACGVPKRKAKYHSWLEAHELYEMDYPNGRMIFKELVPLCHACHNFIHSGRMNMLVDKGEMDERKMNEILWHGKAIIKVAGLKKPKPPTECAEWSKWRLVFNGQEYKPKFKNFGAWADHFMPESEREYDEIPTGND